MNKDGYIQLPRSITDEEDYYKDRFTRTQAYIDLFFLAAWTERTFRIRGNAVTIKRGQVATSENNLAVRWGWSRNTVRKFISELEKDGKIEHHKSRIINVITLNSYYQPEQQNEQQIEQQIEQPIINNNKVKEYKKDTNVSQKDFSTDFVPDYVDNAFRDIYIEWMNYRSQVGKPYKSDIGRKRFYNELIRLSAGDPQKARLIIQQSEANEWQGIFEIKQDNNNDYEQRNTNNRPNHRPSPDENIADAQKAAIERMQSVINSAD